MKTRQETCSYIAEKLTGGRYIASFAVRDYRLTVADAPDGGWLIAEGPSELVDMTCYPTVALALDALDAELDARQGGN